MASPKSTAGATIILLLRLFTFIFLVVSLIVMAADKLTLPDDSSGSGKTKITFKDVYAYRYVLSVAVIGCAYTLLQIPLAAYRISTTKNTAGSDGAGTVFVFIDVVFSLLLASGVGAGFGFTVDVKRIIDEVLNAAPDSSDYNSGDLSGLSSFQSKIDKFFDLIHISTSFLLGATVFMAILCIVSFHFLAKK